MMMNMMMMTTTMKWIVMLITSDDDIFWPLCPFYVVCITPQYVEGLICYHGTMAKGMTLLCRVDLLSRHWFVSDQFMRTRAKKT